MIPETGQLELDRSKVHSVLKLSDEVLRPLSHIVHTGETKMPAQRRKPVNDSRKSRARRDQFALQPLEGQVLEIWELESKVENEPVVAEGAIEGERG